MTDQQLVDMMESVWTSIAALGETFSEAQWKTATDCPNWSVQDQVSHLVGSESRILGRPAPDHAPTEVGHVKNDVGARNETAVDWRRSWPGARVLEEFREVTAERLGLLRAMTTADFAAETQTPIGPGTMSDYLRIRIFDAWVHEQDIRRSLQRPGHMEGPAAEHAMGRTAMAMPFVVGRKAQTPDGATVVFDITGPAGLSVAIEVQSGRGVQLVAVPAAPTVRLTMDTETFVCLGCGRWEPMHALQSGRVRIDGDRTLGETIVSQMSFMI